MKKLISVLLIGLCTQVGAQPLPPRERGMRIQEAIDAEVDRLEKEGCQPIMVLSKTGYSADYSNLIVSVPYQKCNGDPVRGSKTVRLWGYKDNRWKYREQLALGYVDVIYAVENGIKIESRDYLPQGRLDSSKKNLTLITTPNKKN